MWMALSSGCASSSSASASAAICTGDATIAVGWRIGSIRASAAGSGGGTSTVPWLRQVAVHAAKPPLSSPIIDSVRAS